MNIEIKLLKLHTRARQAAREHFAAQPAMDVVTPRLLPVQPDKLPVFRLGNGLSLAYHSDLEMRYLAARHHADVYQIAPVFRAETLDKTHLFEFTLVETIRIRRTLEATNNEVLQLLKSIFMALGQTLNKSSITITSNVTQATVAHEVFYNGLEVASFYADSRDGSTILQTFPNAPAKWIEAVCKGPPTMQAGIGIERVMQAALGLDDVIQLRHAYFPPAPTA